jgi:hypothetical protein
MEICVSNVILLKLGARFDYGLCLFFGNSEVMTMWLRMQIFETELVGGLSKSYHLQKVIVLQI